MSRSRRADNDQLELDPVQVLPNDSIRPAPENNDVYQPISAADPAIHELAQSIKEIGIREPIIVSTDRFIISGIAEHGRQDRRT